MVIVLSLLLFTAAFLILFVFVLFFFLIFDLFLDLPYVGAKRHQIETIIKLAKIKKAVGLIEPEGSSEPKRPEKNRRRETVVDLGSGDGRLLFAVAEAGAYAIGYEINPLLVFLTHLHAGLKGLTESVKVYKKSLWQADLKVADVIFVYAKRKTMSKFENFVYSNAKKGTRVIANTNPFPNKIPTKSENGIFLYTV